MRVIKEDVKKNIRKEPKPKGLEKKIMEIESATANLKATISKEKELIYKAIEATRGMLYGKFNISTDNRTKKFEDFSLKLKINKLHVLISHYYFYLFKCTYIKKEDRFENTKICHSWEQMRDYISINQLITAIGKAIDAKIAEGKKQEMEAEVGILTIADNSMQIARKLAGHIPQTLNVQESYEVMDEFKDKIA